MPDTHLPASILQPDIRLRHFGPATVCGVLADSLEVEVGGERSLARLAISCVYQPCIGDVVLLAASQEAAYVIGVLQGSGPATILAPRDLRLWAPNGRIELRADSLSVSAEEIDLHAGCLEVAADRLRETFGTVQRTVREVFDVDAGEIRIRVREMFELFTRRFRTVADEDAKIVASHIDLG